MHKTEKERGGMELKYCERCGSLWVRRTREARPYCDACAPAMASPRTRRKRAPAGERRRP